jgi:hypothetical protein
LLESSDQLTPELRHDLLPRQSKHAEHFGEIDVEYAARRQALALDQQLQGDAFCIDHFAKLEGAVGGALQHGWLDDFLAGRLRVLWTE